MADGNSSILNLLLMETNSHNNDWGTQLNNDFTTVDRAAGIKTNVVVTTGGTVVRTQDQLIEVIQRITGVLTSNCSIEVPAALQRANLWINNTTGNFTMTIKVIGQTGVGLLRGDSKILRCNGTDVIDAGMPAYSQLAGIAEWLGSTTGTNAYSVPGNQYVGVLADGLQINCFVVNGNTAAATLNFASSGFKSIVHSDGSATASGDIPAGSLKTFTYHLNTDKWFMGEVSASAIAKSSSSNNWSAPQTFSGDVTFTGNVIDAPSVLTDAAPIPWDMGATSRNVQVTLSVTRAMGTPTNQVVGQSGYMEFIQPAGGACNVTFPGEFDPMLGTPRIDQSASARTVFRYRVVALNAIQIWPLYMSGRNSIGFYREFDLGSFSSGTESVAHGLGGYPALMQAYAECISPDQTYAVGDRLLIGGTKESDNGRGFNVAMNATNVFVRIGTNNPILITNTGATGDTVEMTKSRWKIVIRVYE